MPPLTWQPHFSHRSEHCTSRRLTMGAQEPSRKRGFLGTALVVCLEGFPHHHAGSRIQLNQSVWKTSCLVTCGFRHNILQRLVGILDAGPDREARCKYCRGKPRWADGERFLFQHWLEWFSEQERILVVSSFLLPCCSSLNKHYNSGWKLARQHLFLVQKVDIFLLCGFVVK